VRKEGQSKERTANLGMVWENKSGTGGRSRGGELQPSLKNDRGKKKRKKNKGG